MANLVVRTPGEEFSIFRASSFFYREFPFSPPFLGVRGGFLGTL